MDDTQELLHEKPQNTVENTAHGKTQQYIQNQIRKAQGKKVGSAPVDAVLA